MAQDRNSSSQRDSDAPEGDGRDPDKERPGRKDEPTSFSFRHFLRTSADSASSGASNGPSPLSSATQRPRPSSHISASVGAKFSPPAPGGSSSPAATGGGPNLGARPKVQQHSLHNGLHNEQLPRMKRSPKFPSFDSHASLSEYSEEEVQSSFVQRSHSNYEVETPSAASFGASRRSPVVGQAGTSRDSLSHSPAASASSAGPARSSSDFQAALPDFVKDHIVLEQWYQLNPFRADDAQAPPTASPVSAANGAAAATADVAASPARTFPGLFDLAMAPHARLATNSPTVPLDVPGNERVQIPLDLTERHRSRGESPPPAVQADMMQTLPDFLSDGPIHSSGRMADVAQDLPQLDSPEENATVHVISRLRLENDRLRHELDEARRLIADQGRQVAELERTSRAGASPQERGRLNQRIAQLTDEVSALRRENEALREEDGAVGGNAASDRDKAPTGSNRAPLRSFQLARELNLAADTAEANLRQLLAGVGNLRTLASQVEGRDPIEDYISDCDEDEDFLGEGAVAGGAGL